MGRTRWLSCAAVALLAAGLHLRTLGFDFVFDDLHLIVHNSFLREPWSLLTCFGHDFWHGTPFGAAYYRPLVTLSLALNGRLLGWGPAGFHLFNVLLHAANALLLLFVARRQGAPEWPALGAAALFAVHPAAAWAVGSIVARVDLLPAFFLLLAWLRLRAANNGHEEREGERRPDRVPQALWVGLFFLLALLAKESAVAFLAVPILGLRRMRGDPEGRSPGRPIVAAVGAALALYLALRRVVGLGIVMDRSLVDPLSNPLGILPFPERLWAAVQLAGRYVLYLFAPVGFHDPHDYLDRSALPGPLDAGVILSVLVLLAWTSVVLVLWLRRDRIALPLAFSLASFLPASNVLFPIGSLYAENFLYLPLLGLCLASAELLGRIRPESPQPRRALVLPAGLILVLLATASCRESGIWRDGISLFSALAERFPGYPPAHSGLGVMLIDRGRPNDAIGPLRHALALTDRSVEAHYNLGVALLLTRKERAGREESCEHFLRAIEIDPMMVPARLQAGRVLLLLDRPAAAAVQYRELAHLQPANLEIRSRLVDSLIRAGLLQEARAEALSARRDFPGQAWFDFCLARVEARTAHDREALALLEAAISRDGTARTWIRQVDDFNAYRGTPEFNRILNE